MGHRFGGQRAESRETGLERSRIEAVIEAATMIEHAKPLSHAANEADESKLIAQTLEAFLQSQQPKVERICVGMPGRMVLNRQIELPPIDTARTPKFIEFEAGCQFPIPLDQLAWDYHLFGGMAGSEGRRAFAVAAKRTTVQRWIEAFRRLRINVDVLQTDFIALHNFLAHEYFPAPAIRRRKRRSLSWPRWTSAAT